jgi:MipA family protein
MFRRLLVATILLLTGTQAIAQGGLFGFGDDYGPSAGDVAGADAEARWRFALGGGLAVAPNFQGSDKYRLRPVPFAAASYGRFFLGFGGLGVNLVRQSGWRLGALLSYGGGRREDVDARLAGMGDIDRTLNAGVYAVNFTSGFLTRAVVHTDAGGEGHGTLARLDVMRRFRVDEKLGFFAGPGITWGSRQHNQTFFGVTDEQSMRSGLPAHEAGSGINSLRFTAGTGYRINPNWRVIGSLSAARLSGDAGASPIVETRAQYLGFFSAVYLFR